MTSLFNSISAFEYEASADVSNYVISGEFYDIDTTSDSAFHNDAAVSAHIAADVTTPSLANNADVTIKNGALNNAVMPCGVYSNNVTNGCANDYVTSIGFQTARFRGNFQAILGTELELEGELGSGGVGGNDEERETYLTVLLGVLLTGFAVVTVLGNGLVIAAVARERYLRTVTNYFIVSLAVADLLIGVIVMPFSIALEVTGGRWPFGGDWCDVWHSFDVLASTASILNLSVISLDRYWAITDPIAYPRRMSATRSAALVALVWLAAATISFPAITWWRHVTPANQLEERDRSHVCLFTDDAGYLIFSSIVSFYLPVAVILFAYYRIYVAATAQTRGLITGSKVIARSKTNRSKSMKSSDEKNNGEKCPKSDIENGGEEKATEVIALRVHRGRYKPTMTTTQPATNTDLGESGHERLCCGIRIPCGSYGRSLPIGGNVDENRAMATDSDCDSASVSYDVIALRAISSSSSLRPQPENQALLAPNRRDYQVNSLLNLAPSGRGFQSENQSLLRFGGNGVPLTQRRYNSTVSLAAADGAKDHSGASTNFGAPARVGAEGAGWDPRSSSPVSSRRRCSVAVLSRKWASATLRRKIGKVAKERKAAKTLGVVIGVFCVCWVPFFVTNLAYGLCHEACVHHAPLLFSLFTWLGYINSCMNPVIYAYSMRDFRRAFHRIVCGGCSGCCCGCCCGCCGGCDNGRGGARGRSRQGQVEFSWTLSS